jgi:hypothetical protein
LSHGLREHLLDNERQPSKPIKQGTLTMHPKTLYKALGPLIVALGTCAQARQTV